MTGTFINVVAIVAGTLVGVLVGPRLPERMRERVMWGLGLVTLVIGVDLALAWRDTDPLYVLGGVLLGGLAGEALRIEDRLAALGDRIQQTVSAHRPSRVSEAFFTASLLFCVGPLAVVGAIQDGLTGDYEALATKSLLDGFASIPLAATMGWGVVLAAGSVFVYQGALATGAAAFEDVLTGETLAALTSAGGILIIGISLRLLEVKDVKVGNYLPALVIAPVLAAIFS